MASVSGADSDVSVVDEAVDIFAEEVFDALDAGTSQATKSTMGLALARFVRARVASGCVRSAARAEGMGILKELWERIRGVGAVCSESASWCALGVQLAQRV